MQPQSESDAMLRRFERNQIIGCLGMAALAAVVGRLDVAAGVMGGGLLIAIGYAAIKGAVTVFLSGTDGTGHDRAGRREAARRAWTLVKFLGRYALLALAAYVMLICLHLHPVGLLLGASAPVVAAVIELVRVTRNQHSR